MVLQFGGEGEDFGADFIACGPFGGAYILRQQVGSYRYMQVNLRHHLIRQRLKGSSG